MTITQSFYELKCYYTVYEMLIYTIGCYIFTSIFFLFVIKKMQIIINKI